MSEDNTKDIDWDQAWEECEITPQASPLPCLFFVVSIISWLVVSIISWNPYLIGCGASTFIGLYWLGTSDES